MVHGTALSQAIWRGFGYLADFAGGYTVITLDLRGHGRSDKPHDPAGYRMEFFVADVIAVLDDLEISAAHYLGYSLGARVGFALASTQQTRMLSFVSAGGAHGSDVGQFDRVFFPGCQETLENKGMPAFLDAWEQHRGAKLDAATRLAIGANDALALAAYMREAEHDAGVSETALAKIDIRTLLVAGDRDQERLPIARHLSSVMPNASLQVLDGAGHADTLIHPAARPAIGAFLEAAPTGPPSEDPAT